MTPSGQLFAALREPAAMANLSGTAWNALIRAGRAERLLGTIATLAHETGVFARLPASVRAVLTDEAEITAFDQRFTAWEVDRARHALSNLGVPVVLLKGAAYLHAGLPAARGRRIGDLDILVPRGAIADVEAALTRHGWTPAKDDAYDNSYYRNWMHEIPPLVHGERGGVIDVHHTILPLTARLTPDAARLVETSVMLEDGLRVLGPAEMLLHAAAHCAYDGEFEGGARNLWDIHQLTAHFSVDPDFWADLECAARHHQLAVPLARSLRLARHLYGTGFPDELRGRTDLVDLLALRKLHGRDAYGKQTAMPSHRLLYIRGHWLRMPPLLLARHLTRKYLARRAKARG